MKTAATIPVSFLEQIPTAWHARSRHEHLYLYGHHEEATPGESLRPIVVSKTMTQHSHGGS